MVQLCSNPSCCPHGLIHSQALCCPLYPSISQGFLYVSVLCLSLSSGDTRPVKSIKSLRLCPRPILHSPVPASPCTPLAGIDRIIHQPP